MMTSVTLRLCHAPSKNYIYTSQMILHRLEVVFEIVLHYRQLPVKKVSTSISGSFHNEVDNT